MTNLLFVHQNYPAQFKHLAPALASRPGTTVRAMHMRGSMPPVLDGVGLIPVPVARSSTPGLHPWLSDFEPKVIRAEAAYRVARRLRAEGYTPDAIIAHPGWGESLFLKDVWPRARLGLYCEFYYSPDGTDVGFDPEFGPPPEGDECRLALKNLSSVLHFQRADAALAPTKWQAETFPSAFRERMTVVHDGIDTDQVKPDPSVSVTLGGREVLTTADEVVTFVNRSLEPYRGYHIFMRALPDLLRARPQARVLIIGGDGVSYGVAPPHGTWKERFIQEVRPRIPDADWARVFFLGSVPYAHFLAVLRVSSVHVYLTYPFVLSWSLLEAMSAGCAIVASDTAPVREAVEDGKTGVLVDFFDPSTLAQAVADLLADAPRRQRLGQAARVVARKRYDLRRVCLPQQMHWVDRLIDGPCKGESREEPQQE